MADYPSAPAFGDDLNMESVDALRQRLDQMKRLMAERTAQQQENPASTEEIWSNRGHKSAGIIDGQFLSMAFGGVLLVNVTVAIYAFYNLCRAVLKRFPSTHDEL